MTHPCPNCARHTSQPGLCYGCERDRKTLANLLAAYTNRGVDAQVEVLQRFGFHTCRQRTLQRYLTEEAAA